MNSRNGNLKTSLLRPEGALQDIEQRDNLNAQFQSLMEHLRAKKRDFQAMQAQMEQLRTNHGPALLQSKLQAVAMDKLVFTSQNLGREVAEQDDKKSRASKQVQRLVQQLRVQGGTNTESLEEKEAKLQQLLDVNNKILFDLDAIVLLQPDIAPAVSLMLSKTGLSLPSKGRTSRTGTSVASSTPSVASSHRIPPEASMTSADVAKLHQAKPKPISIAPKVFLTSPLSAFPNLWYVLNLNMMTDVIMTNDQSPLNSHSTFVVVVYTVMILNCRMLFSLVVRGCVGRG